MITLRNIGHYIVFGMIAYLIGNVTNVHMYKGIENFIFIALVGAIIGGFFGFVFDWLQEISKVGVFDITDVLRSSIGGLIGGALAFFVASDILFWIFICFCLIILIFELYFNFYKKIKK